MFKRNKKHPPYDDTPVNQRTWLDNGISLIPVGGNDGHPMIYARGSTRGTPFIKRLWVGTVVYASASDAVFAAEVHIEDAFAALLKSTPERNSLFSEE